jgi:preprotein translocase subunit SecE
MAKAATIMRDEEGLVGKMKALPARISSFLSDVRNEMRKVTFPSRKEVQATTLVVIITVIIFGVFFFAVDQAIGNGVTWVLKHAPK